jgi:uncharacterized membrane protein (DUF485 family)
MDMFDQWLKEPLSQKSSIKLWLACAALVFLIWFVTPSLLAWSYPAQFLAIPLSPRNIAVAMSTSFGEEFVFRVLPGAVVLYFLPKRATLALLAGLGAAYPFGMWHDWGMATQVCLGVGSAFLVVAYLKFGGASGRPFSGLLACGSIHTACNIVSAAIAHIVIAW